MASRGVPTTRISAARWRAVRLFAMDVDGILTDGTVGVASDGTETKRFSILDGLGLVRLGAAESPRPGSAEGSRGPRTTRAAELRIPHVIQGRIDKLPVLRELAAGLGFRPAQCVYMGDDDIDAPAIAAAGIGISVPTAFPRRSRPPTTSPAGRPGFGAVREVCDLLMASRAKGHGNPKARRRTKAL